MNILETAALVAFVALILAVLPGELDRLSLPGADRIELVDCATPLQPGEHRATLSRADGKIRVQCGRNGK